MTVAELKSLIADLPDTERVAAWVVTFAGAQRLVQDPDSAWMPELDTEQWETALENFDDQNSLMDAETDLTEALYDVCPEMDE